MATFCLAKVSKDSIQGSGLGLPFYAGNQTYKATTAVPTGGAVTVMPFQLLFLVGFWCFWVEELW